MVQVTCHCCGKDKDEHVSQGGKFYQCSQCKSVSYCSKECQLKDWKSGGHKAICQKLNVGDAKQATHSDHLRMAAKIQSMVDGALNDFPPDFSEGKMFFKLFLNSKPGDDHMATAKKMQNLFRGFSKFNKQVLLFRSLTILINYHPEMLEIPCSPLTIALKYVDPNVLSRPSSTYSDGGGSTPLHWLAEMASPYSEYSLINQVTLGIQLLEAGANPNAKAEAGLDKVTPLHRACHSAITTNLDFIELLLKSGANPNATNSLGETPLMHSMGAAPSAALLLLQDPRTDPNIETKDGRRILPMVRSCIMELEYKSSIPGNPNREQLLYNLKQIRDVETKLLELGAK